MSEQGYTDETPRVVVIDCSTGEPHEDVIVLPDGSHVGRELTARELKANAAAAIERPEPVDPLEELARAISEAATPKAGFAALQSWAEARLSA